MQPKVTMKAPPQIDGGTIHASQSGKAYDIGLGGLVTVDSADVKDLTGAGFTIQPADDVSDETKQTTASVSPTSATQGATALDPAAREHNRRSAGDTLQGSAPNQGDHGNADPGHGAPAADTSDPKVGADAMREAEVTAASGGDPTKPSAQAETGGANQQASTTSQQAAAGQVVPDKNPPQPPPPTKGDDKPASGNAADKPKG